MQAFTKSAISFILIALVTLGGVMASAYNGNNEGYLSEASENTREDPVIVCGDKTSGTFGMMPETHRYRVYLQANKGVAFMSNNGTIMNLTVYKPDGTMLGVVNSITDTSLARFKVFTTPVSGYYTVSVNGACGDYYFNCLTGQNTTSNSNPSYAPSVAVAYADYWVNSYNPLYVSYVEDSVNFTSQALFHGGMPMTQTNLLNSDHMWFYSNGSNKSYSWNGADRFMRHWTKIRSSSYFGRAYSVKIYSQQYVSLKMPIVYANTQPGDIVLFLNGDESDAYHAIVITEKNNNMLFFKTHSSVMNSGSLATYISQTVPNDNWVVVIRIKN